MLYVFVITDSSRRMDWPWCYCFVKETTLCAPTLNLWLAQSYILTHAGAFNIREPRFRIGTEAPDIHVMMRFTGRCGQVLYFCGISMYVCISTIYANNYSAKYTAKIDSSISGFLFKYVTWS